MSIKYLHFILEKNSNKTWSCYKSSHTGVILIALEIWHNMENALHVVCLHAGATQFWRGLYYTLHYKLWICTKKCKKCLRDGTNSRIWHLTLRLTKSSLCCTKATLTAFLKLLCGFQIVQSTSSDNYSIFKNRVMVQQKYCGSKNKCSSFWWLFY